MKIQSVMHPAVSMLLQRTDADHRAVIQRRVRGVRQTCRRGARDPREDSGGQTLKTPAQA